jgi:ABC-type nickel/cobalt efflux system permease component RcnA
MKTKAAFLLVVFLLNTVVGFGCALGMQENHDDENHSHPRSAVHEHKDHQHNQVEDHEHQITPIPGLDFSKEDPCCKKIVNELTIQSKLIPESAKILIVLPVVWLDNYAYALLVPVNSIEPSQKGYVYHRYRPPNEDIRIIIQSFQI